MSRWRRIQGDEDAFWQIALTADVSKLPTTDGADSSTVDGDHHGGIIDRQADDQHDDLDPVVTTAAHSYRLPNLVEAAFPNGVALRLSGLSTGIGSPLGEQAWYGSALLSAVLLVPTDDLREALAHADAALELGSGAVGLSGLALACAIARNNHQRSVLRPSVPSRIVLTDHDVLVLTQLQANVDRATAQLSQEYPDVLLLPDVSVRRLDWGDAALMSGEAGASLSDIRLIVGSELVYTAQNAQACAEMVLALLRRNPRALVVIVQVTDREGWSAVFLPALDASKEVQVRSEPIDPAWHDAASSMIPLGGTTDRFDFGVCYISRAN